MQILRIFIDLEIFVFVMGLGTLAILPGEERRTLWSGFYFQFSFVYKLSFSLELSIESVLELLVLKNGAECTGQRLKCTSGARVMIIFGGFIYKWRFSL